MYKRQEAEICGGVISIKNPKSGVIIVDSVGDLVWDDPVMECNGKVVIRNEIKVSGNDMGICS